jgi:hypothetical protein
MILSVYIWCLLGVYLAMASLAIIFEKKNNEGAGLSSSLINEVAEMWQKQPFVDAIVF